KDANGRDQDVILPGEREAALDQELSPIGADDLARFAAQLQPRQGGVNVISVGHLSGDVKRLENGVIQSSEPLGLDREWRQLVDAYSVVVTTLSYATLLPPSLNALGVFSS